MYSHENTHLTYVKELFPLLVSIWSSIVRNFFWCRTLPHKVVRIVLLGVPFMPWILNVIAPPHCFTILLCRCQWGTFHYPLRIYVLGTWSPLHKRTLIITPRLKCNNPIFAQGFNIRMIMCMFNLWLINSGYLCLINISIKPGDSLRCKWACSLIKLWPLVKAYFVRIHFNLQIVSVRGHTHPLNCSILQFFSIWSCSGWHSPNIVIKLLRNGLEGFLSDYSAEGSNIFWRHINIKL